MNKESIISYIEKNFTEKRRVHTYAVRDTAMKLAEVYGADKEKAEIAALFHDMFRGTSEAVINMYVRQLGLPERYLNNPNLAHGKIAAIIMKRDYGIEDEDIINAVDYHTTGRAGMSLLEKIIYLADAIEPNRNYPTVDELREMAYKGLDAAVIKSLENSISYIESKGLYLDPDTVLARDYLLGKEENV